MKKYLLLILLTLFVITSIYFSGCSKKDNFGVNITAFNSSLEATDDIEVLDTLLIGISGLRPKAQYSLQIYRKSDGTPLFADNTGAPIPVIVNADQNGRVPPTAMWYDVGLPTSGASAGNVSGVDIDSYRVILQGDGVSIELPFFTINTANKPKVWACKGAADETLENSFAVGDNVYVTGKDFPPNTAVTIRIVNDRSRYFTGDTVGKEITQINAVSATTDANGNIPITLSWPTIPNLAPGNVLEYDVWVDINNDSIYNSGNYGQLVNIKDAVDSILASGFVVQFPPAGVTGVVQELSSTGSVVSYNPPDYFGYADTFDDLATGTGQNYYQSGPGIYTYFNSLLNYGTLGYDQMVRVWIVSMDSWNDINADPDKKIHPSMDVSGGFENVHVQWRCYNFLPYLIWPAPLTCGDYVIIIDVDHDNKYDPTDIVDGIKTTDAGYPGFTVSGQPLTVNTGFTVQ